MERSDITYVSPLQDSEIHLWWADLNLTETTTLHWNILDPDEQARALRFKRDRDRHQYILVRSILRRLISVYVGIPAAELRFCYGGKGKPALANLLLDERIEFNVSHSHHFALWGLGRHPLGVDVEHVKSDVQADRIAKRFFTTREYTAFQSQSPDLQRDFFYQLWTRKEACIKAKGESLFEQIGELEVPCCEGEQSRWLLLEKASLYVQNVRLHPAYAVAIASVREGLQLSCFDVNVTEGLTLLS